MPSGLRRGIEDDADHGPVGCTEPQPDLCAACLTIKHRRVALPDLGRHRHAISGCPAKLVGGEEVQHFGAALSRPDRGVRDRGAILQSEQLGQDIGSGSRFIGVGLERVGRGLSARGFCAKPCQQEQGSENERSAIRRRPTARAL